MADKPKSKLTMGKNNIFTGTSKRDKMMQSIVQMARELLPMSQKEFINTVAFNTGLTTRKVQEDYIDLLVTVHIIQINRFDYELGSAEKDV